MVVDAYSRWLEVKGMKGTTNGKTIEKLRIIFATHGFPQVIVSDNASNFASEEFKVFLKYNGIKYIFTPPYHPNSNGLAERAYKHSRGLWLAVEMKIHSRQDYQSSYCDTAK